MKKKKWIIASILSFCILMSFIGISVFSSMEYDPNSSNSEIAKSDTVYVRKNAEKTKIIQDANEEEKILTYTETDRSMENEIDVYEDEYGNSYMYDEAGNIKMYISAPSNDSTNTSTHITEKGLIDTAWNYAVQTYGDRISGFEFIRIQTYTAEMGTSVYFGNTYGVDNFIVGSQVIVTLSTSGSLKSCTLRKEETIPFNGELVKDLTENTVLLDASRQFLEEYPNYQDASINLSSCEITLQNDEFVIQVLLNCTYDGLTFKELYYYTI
ncbi:MAG: hypothetical protein IJ043_04630 [Clostridia bacterium]|nr:hypothetical protein [Clostridia bacterium]